jgi:hypothetical protein
MSASKPKAPRVNRTVFLKVRLKPGELPEARLRAEGRSLSSIARAALVGLPMPTVKPGPKPPEPMSSYERAKIVQLAWFGNNLNQLARAANSRQLWGSLLLLALLRLERTMREVGNAR